MFKKNYKKKQTNININLMKRPAKDEARRKKIINNLCDSFPTSRDDEKSDAFFISSCF